jgi:hypothetical protein
VASVAATDLAAVLPDQPSVVLLDPGAVQQDERAMRVVEWIAAFVAVAAALLLTLIR